MYRYILHHVPQKHRISRCIIFGSTTVASAMYSSTRGVTFFEGKNDRTDNSKEKDKSPTFFERFFGKQESPEEKDKSPTFLERFLGKKESTEDSSKGSPESSDNKRDNVFFDAQQWEQIGREKTEQAKDFWNKILSDTAVQDKRKMDDDGTKKNSKASADVSGLAGDFMKLFGGGKEQQKSAISEIVAKARQTASKSDVSDDRSFGDLLEALYTYKSMIEKVADKYISSIDFSKFDPTAFFYYLEYEDERKNPSWKRRKHRFYDGIDIERVERLNEYLKLAHISYHDTVEEIREDLENHVDPCELVYAEVNSEPGKPANYVAIPRNQPKNAKHLEVIIGVRGTKSLADTITDLVCEDAEYRGGKAHAFILKSGKYICEKHTAMLEELLSSSGKSKLRLRLVGHSLGAGAASIAGMEFHDNEKFDVNVVGFGCPALLSQDLAMNAEYITTVVNDSDMVPRMSGISVANLLMDVMQFDWFEYAERDAQEAIEALHEKQPFVFNRDLLLKLKQILTPHIKAYAESMIVKKTVERGEVELFPPGNCIHIYRDGVGYSGNFVPNTFFSEIDVSRRMVDDHVFKTGYEQTFLELMRQHKGDHHFRFDVDVNVDAK